MSRRPKRTAAGGVGVAAGQQQLWILANSRWWLRDDLRRPHGYPSSAAARRRL